MNRRGIAVVSMLLCATFTAAQAADWPTYRNDHARTAATPEQLGMPLRPAWTYSAPAAPQPAWSSAEGRVIEGKEIRHRVKFDDALHPVVVGNRAYFGSSVDHQVYCLDLETGKTSWTFFTGGPVRLSPTISEGRVYFGSDDGFAYCVEATDGKLVWKLRAGPSDEWLLARGDMISRWPVRTGVSVDGGVAYFGAGIFPHEDVYLFAVDAATGNVIWKQDDISESDAGRNDLSPQGYLLASESTLFVPSGRSLPAAFDRKTGEMLHKRTASWRGDGGGVIGGTKGLLADGQLYSGAPHHFLAMDQKSGSVGFAYVDGREMAVAGDLGFVANGSRVLCFRRQEYAEASRARQKLNMEVQSLSRSLRSAGNKADEIRQRIAKARAEIEQTEKVGVVWQTPSKLDSALIVAGDTVFVGGVDSVVGLSRETGKETWQSSVAGEARGLAAANGRLLVSTTAGKIYTFAADAKPAQVEAAKNEDPYPQDNLTGMYQAAAEEILKRSGVKEGFCLVVGAETGRLAYELARRSELKIYGVEPDAEKVAEARRRLSSAGLYGNRVTVHQTDLSAIPYSNYFANLIVSDTSLLTGQLRADAEHIAQHLKPIGGTILLGGPADRPQGADFVTPDVARKWLAQTKLEEQSEIKQAGAWTMLVRGKLPGAADWSHQYGNAGNTAATEDRRVKNGLGVLWYGDPGPGSMLNRHDGAVGPLAINGRLIVQGTDSVMAYDAYNGQFLWEQKNPESIRTGVFQNQNPGNLVAGGDRVFVMVRDECRELDAATGKVNARHRLPEDKDDGKYEWGYVAYQDGLLFGTASLRKELEERQRRRGRQTEDATDTIFAIDVATGKHAWSYQGKNISHHTVALGPEHVYFIDAALTAEQREELLRQDKSDLKKLTGEEAKLAEERMKRLDARLAVALDAKTGKQAWSKPVDVTDCSEIGTGGGELTLMYQNNVLVLCGANANGHYWNQFLSGEFKQRRLVALSAGEGDKLWAEDANYRHRPIVVEDRIIAEPWAFDLYTGEQLTRPHPLTGQPVPWSIMRPGHHCGMLTGCPSMLMFRSGYTGFYDLENDAGTRHFAGHRLGCWINAIPANGLVMIPEASAGCVCLFSIASTIVMEPREARRPWALFSSVGPTTPVERMALNFGAPGDRRDERGNAWLAYPRPAPHKNTGLDLPLNLNHKFVAGGRFTSRDARTFEIVGTQSPWLYSSAAQGLQSCELPLRGPDDGPAEYTVRLHFAAHSDDGGTKPFNVKLQGKTVLKNASLTGAKRTAVVREIEGVQVADNLRIELVADDGFDSADLPVLNAVEVVRTGTESQETN